MGLPFGRWVRDRADTLDCPGNVKHGGVRWPSERPLHVARIEEDAKPQSKEQPARDRMQHDGGRETALPFIGMGKDQAAREGH